MRKHMLSSLFLMLFTAPFFVGCASKPVSMNEVQEGRWQGKALIKDVEQGRSYIVYLNVNAVRNQRIRMDVTSTLGTGVATILSEPNEVRYILFDSKRFYYGQPQPNVMRPVLAMPFDPRWFQNLLFDEPIEGKGWICKNDGSGRPDNCRDAVSNTQITWSNRAGEKKTVLIEHPKATVQINFQSFQAKVEDRKNLFVLEAPPAFQKLRVR